MDATFGSLAHSASSDANFVPDDAAIIFNPVLPRFETKKPGLRNLFGNLFENKYPKETQESKKETQASKKVSRKATTVAPPIPRPNGKGDTTKYDKFRKVIKFLNKPLNPEKSCKISAKTKVPKSDNKKPKSDFGRPMVFWISGRKEKVVKQSWNRKIIKGMLQKLPEIDEKESSIIECMVESPDAFISSSDMYNDPFRYWEKFNKVFSELSPEQLEEWLQFQQFDELLKTSKLWISKN